MKIVAGMVQGSTVETLKEGEQVVPLSVVRQIVREELAAVQENEQRHTWDGVSQKTWDEVNNDGVTWNVASD